MAKPGSVFIPAHLGHFDEFLFVFCRQYVDGYGACAGGWRAAAIGQLGRVGHVGADGWFWPYTIGTCAPAEG